MSTPRRKNNNGVKRSSHILHKVAALLPWQKLESVKLCGVMLAKSQGLRTVRKVLSLACNLTSNVAEDPDFIFTVTCILLSSDSSQSMRGNPQRSRHICIATKVI
jgi:hypothetical protein